MAPVDNNRIKPNESTFKSISQPCLDGGEGGGGRLGSEEGDKYDERGGGEGGFFDSLVNREFPLSHPAMALNRVLIKLTGGSIAAVIGYLYFPT